MKRKERQRRSATPGSYIAYYMSQTGTLPEGYHRLLDSPEVAACVNAIASPISSATIYLMENGKKGDQRVRDALARFVDVTPCPMMGTRQAWMDWIVTTMLTDRDGSAFVLPRFADGKLADLRPMPGASCTPLDDSYAVNWQGRRYDADEVLHFRMHSDPDEPWRGRGLRTSAESLAASLRQTERLKEALSNPEYKPPLIVSVDSDSDLSDPELRDEFRREYLESDEAGKPWVIPGGMVTVNQVKPLNLSDLAVADTVRLDRQSIASLIGVPAFLLGVGDYSQKAYNNFIQRVIVPICVGIEQELTSKLLTNASRYFAFNRRRLYAYDVSDLVGIYLSMHDRGIVTGDEVRETAMLDPAGLTDFKVLENYIPTDMIGQQKKLIQEAMENGDE